MSWHVQHVQDRNTPVVYTLIGDFFVKDLKFTNCFVQSVSELDSARLYNMAQKSEFLLKDYKAIAIHVGINNALSVCDPEEFARDIQKAIEIIRNVNPSAVILLSSILFAPSLSDSQHISRQLLNHKLDLVANQNRGVVFCTSYHCLDPKKKKKRRRYSSTYEGIQNALKIRKLQMNHDFYSDDGLHLSSLGVNQLQSYFVGCLSQSRQYRYQLSL